MNKNNIGHILWGKKDIQFLIFIPTLSVFLFLIFVYSLNSGYISRDDYWHIQLDYFLPANHFLSSFPSFWLNVTHLGDAFVLFPFLSLFLIYRPQVWIALFMALPLGVILSQGGKRLAEMPRPAAVLNDEQITTIGGALTAHTSLPSGHTVTVFAAITVVLGVLIPMPNKYKHFFWLFVGFVIATTLALPRIAVGAHWPLDILVGSVFGYFAGISGIWFTQCNKNCWQWLNKPNTQLIVGFIMLIWSIFLARQALNDSDHFLLVIWVSALMGSVVAMCLISRRFVRQVQYN